MRIRWYTIGVQRRTDKMTTIITNHTTGKTEVLTDREAILTLRGFDGSTHKTWFADPLAKTDEDFKRHCEDIARLENSTLISIKEVC